LRIGIVRARFNDTLTSALARGCTDKLATLGVPAARVTEVTVPGALEIPLALDAMAATAQFDALVAIGCVIRGETYHFELVSNECGAGVTRVGLDRRIPIANVVLTVENDEQAWARVGKGAEAAEVAVEMALLLARLAASTHQIKGTP
jgi:6,7-dimethyl-8-ribityllumazine synthase